MKRGGQVRKDLQTQLRVAGLNVAHMRRGDICLLGKRLLREILRLAKFPDALTDCVVVHN